MQRPTIRKGGVRIGRDAGKPDRKPFKTPRCIARLIVEDVQHVGDAFVVTVFNSGNLPSHHVRINVYTSLTAPVLIATGSTTLGILERKTVRVIKQLQLIGWVNPHYVVAFDPINDPFPVRRISELSRQEQNLLASSLESSLPGWSQYRFDNNRFGFNEATAVPARTWQLETIAQQQGQVPANPRISRLLYPHNTRSDYSEFRYRVDIVDPFFLSEIRNGNVTIQSSWMLYTYAQTPRDRGGLWLRQSRERPGAESEELVSTDPTLDSPDTWVRQRRHIDADPRLTTITVRLIAERRTGGNNNAYFGNVHCELKHRQVKMWSVTNA